MTVRCTFCDRYAYAYDDFYGDLCLDHLEEKVNRATHNPWNGKPLERKDKVGDTARLSRLVAEDDEKEREIEGINDDTVVIVTETAGYIKAGDTWVNVERIITVGPISSAVEAMNLVDGQGSIPTDGVAIQIDSYHENSQFVIASEDPLEIMNRIVLATDAIEDEDDGE